MTADAIMQTASRGRRPESEVVLGEDWDRPIGALESELVSARERRGMISLNR